MEMKITVFMGATDFRRIDPVEPVLSGNIRGNVIVEPLERIAHIAVFLNFPIQFST
jgi:hypothetical protein